MKATVALGGRVDKSLLKSMSTAEKRMAALKRAGGTVGKGIKKGFKAAGVAAAAVGAGAVKGIKDSVEAGRNFDASMAQVAATMGKSVAEIGDLREFAQDMGASTKFSASESADALNYMALAGYDAEKSMKMLPNVLNLAAAGNIELASASDMVTDAASALGLSTAQTATMVDQMAAASSKSNTSVAQLGEAILTVGGTAKNLAGGTTELSTALGLLADNGVKGAEGGTALRNIILSLSAPTSKAAKQMKELGLEVFDQQGNMRALDDVFGDLGQSFSKMTQKEQTQALKTMFNKVDLKSVNALLGTSAKRWDELAGSIADSSGAAKQMADTQLDNLDGDIITFNSALEGAQIALSDALTPALRDFVQTGTAGLGDLRELFLSDDFAASATSFATTAKDALLGAAQAAREFAEGFGEGFDFEAVSAAVGDFGETVGLTLGDGSPAASAKDFGKTLGEGLSNVLVPAIETAAPIVSGIADAVKFLADNASVAVPVIGGIATAFVTIQGVAGVAGVISTIGGALSAIGVGGAAAAGGLGATAAAEGAAGAASTAAAPPILAVGAAVLMLGGGVALAGAGLFLMAQGAATIASAGPGAAAAMVGMVAAVAGLAVGAAALGPALTAGSVGMLAFGAAVALVGVGVLAAGGGMMLMSGALPGIAMFAAPAGAGLTMMGMAALTAAPGVVALAAALVPAAAAMAGFGWALSGPAGDAQAFGNGIRTATDALGWVAPLADASTGAIGSLGSAMAAGVAPFTLFAAGVTAAMQLALAQVKAACASMQSTVRSLNLTLPRMHGYVPVFSTSGSFNAKNGSVPTVNVNYRYFAQGGFTDGAVAIAGEAGTEAVISFDPRYRDANLGYWLAAGQMLGAFSPYAAGGFTGRATAFSNNVTAGGTLFGAAGGGGSVTVSLGGFTFAPNITVSGTDGVNDINAAIREGSDELRDAFESWFREMVEESYEFLV